MKNTSIFVDSHGAVTLSVDHSSSVGTINGNLLVISSKSVPVGVRIREKPSLKHFINRGLHSGNEVTGRKGRLFSLSKVIFRISVEDQFSNRNERVISLGDHLGDIKDVPLVVEAIFLGNDLNFELPLSSLTSIEVVHEVTSSIIRVNFQIVGLFCCQILDAREGLEVQLDPEGFTLLVDPPESVR